MKIGHIELPNSLFVAPMAGVTDRPFRQLCKRLGAGYAVSEMVTSRRDLWTSLKTSRRADHAGEVEPIAVQIAGTDAAMMAEAAAYNIGRAAQGRPWIFREIAHFLATGEHLVAPEVIEVKRWLLDHLDDHYGLYGEFAGVRSARKHIGWAVRALPGGESFRAEMNLLETC